MAEEREAFATYQGVRCIVASATRTPGLETASYEIEIPARAFAALQWNRPGALYSDVGVTSRVEGAGSLDGVRGALQGALEIRGDLVVFDGARSVTFFNLYVRDDGLELYKYVDDEEGDTNLRVHLVDVRYFGERRGELFGTYNVLLPDGTYDPGTVKEGTTTPRPAAPETSHERVARQRTGSTTVREPPPPIVTAGPPYTLREVVEKILQRYPGRPPIRSMPAAAAAAVPPNLRWNGIRPKEELERLCKTYGLTPNLTVDGHFAFTDEREPYPPDAATGSARQLAPGVALAAGTWKRLRRKSFRHRPQLVRVLGPRVVREARVDLEPAGYGVDADGKPDRRKVLDWVAAGALYGFTTEDLAAFALLPDKDKGALVERLGFERDVAEHLDDWCFRLFRFPKPARGFLPVLSERAETMLAAAEAVGGEDPLEPRRRLPPEAEADVFEEVREPNDRVPGSTSPRPTTPRGAPASTPTFTGLGGGRPTSSASGASGGPAASSGSGAASSAAGNRGSSASPGGRGGGGGAGAPSASRAPGGPSTTTPARVSSATPPPAAAPSTAAQPPPGFDGSQRSTAASPPPTTPPSSPAPTGAPAGGASAPTRIVAGVPLSTLEAIAQSRTRTIFVNREMTDAPASVDRKRGLVHFSGIVGHLVSTDVKTSSQGRLKIPPRARLTFAYEDRPDARASLVALGASSGVGSGGQGQADAATRARLAASPLTGASVSRIATAQVGGGVPRGDGEVGYFYSFLAGRDPAGAIAHLNPELRDPGGLEGQYPLVVEDDTLRMFVTIDGRTNKAKLDERAREIAKALLDAPEETTGEEGLAHGFYELEPSSVFHRVVYTFGNGVQTTEWSVSNVTAKKTNVRQRVETGFTREERRADAEQ